MENYILSPVNKDTLVSEIVSQIVQKLQENSFFNLPTHDDDLIKASEVAKIFKVSEVTIGHWTKEGRLTAYRIGGRKFYKRQEILNALTRTDKYLKK